jgi:hypothetical protein
MGLGFESQGDHNKEYKQYQSRINRTIYAAFLFLGYKGLSFKTKVNGNIKGYTNNT